MDGKELCLRKLTLASVSGANLREKVAERLLIQCILTRLYYMLGIPARRIQQTKYSS